MKLINQPYAPNWEQEERKNRSTTSVNREQPCHYPVAQHGVINEGKHVDSVDVAGVCSYLYQTITNHMVTYASMYDAFIRLNECFSTSLHERSNERPSFARGQI
jgi:hypothetical protein